MLLVAVTAMGIMPTITFAQDSGLGENTSASASAVIEPLVSDGDTGTAVLTQSLALAGAWLSYGSGDSPIGSSMYSIEIGGETHLAYCVDARKPGPETQGSYPIKATSDQSISTTDGNVTISQMEAIINRGYPAKTPAELGLNTSMEAYYATRMAIAMHVNYTNISLWSARSGIPNSQAVLAAALQIGGFPAPNSAEMAAIARSRTVIPPAELARFSGGSTTTDDGRTLHIEVTPEQARIDALLHKAAAATLTAETVQIASVSPLSGSQLTITTTPAEQTAQAESDRLISPNWYTVTNSNGGFKVEWTSGVTGARIYNASNQPVATYPQNATFPSDTQFRISVPADTPSGSVSVNLLGTPIAQETAEKFMFAIPANTAQQPMIFMPSDFNGGDDEDNDMEHSTPATLTWSTTPPPSPPPTTPQPLTTSVRIQKIDALSRENIPGALMRLQGMSNMVVNVEGATSGGPSVINFDNTGINLSQVLTAGATTALPPSGGSSGVTSTVTDGVWTLEGLPFGFYRVEEERAPGGYSLLPQHTSYSFWITPPDITIALKAVGEDGTTVVIPWDEVLAMLESLSGASTPAETLQEVLAIMKDALDAVELEVIPVFDVTQTPQPSSVLLTFENYVRP